MTERENSIFRRSALLVGKEAMESFSAARVILFGTGGVGSWCAESLIRSGIGHLTVVDFDTVGESNMNRQLVATTKTVGLPKVEVLKGRLAEINPDAEITALRAVFSKETAAGFNLPSYDYVIDAIDSLKDKAELIHLSADLPDTVLFSSMGAGSKVDPTRVRVAGFRDVRGCPLGAALRKKMRREGTFPETNYLCVYDEELLINSGRDEVPSDDAPGRVSVNGTMAHITAIFGFTLAGLVIDDILRKRGKYPLQDN